MIRSMTKYSFILLSGDQERFLEELQELGLVDITRSEKPVDDASRQIAGEVELLTGLIQGLNEAVVPEGTDPEHIDGDIVRLAGGQLMRYSEDIAAVKTLEKELSRLEVWGSFDRSRLKALSEAGVPVHFHELSRKAFLSEWGEVYALSIISEEKNTVYFVVFGDNPLPGEVPAPECSADEKRQELEEKKQHLDKTFRRIAGAKERIGELEQIRAGKLQKLDLHLAGVTAVPAAEDTIVTFIGYAPTEYDETLVQALDRSGVLYIKEDACAEDNPPISLKNNRFVSMFETLTDMYGRPAYDGFDPTVFLSIFFLLFFAMCMGDAGYGLVLVITGFLLKKVNSFRKTAPLVITLGVATVFVGFLFHTFFSMDISTWKIFEPIKGIFLPAKIAGYDGAMILSIVIGIIHLCLAMIIKTVMATRNKGFLGSLGTWGWTLLIVGAVIVAGFALAGVIDAAATKLILIVLGIISALGIFVFNDIHRNPLINIGSGLWDTYNTATGLLGDVLSYLRLYALGLAGAMLGFAFNDLGKMVLGDGGVGGWIGFILVVVIGHTLNIAMCALGAFVHPLRLNFLEFFKNSGYEAAGRNYKPLEK